MLPINVVLPEGKGHDVHASSDDVLLYFPGTQREHVSPVRVVPGRHGMSEYIHGPPFGPSEPGLQMQLVLLLLATAEMEFFGHS